MNIKNLSLLMAFACAAPVYATPEIDETQKTPSDRQKEYRACSNMAFSELSVVGGIFAGIATSIASGSTAAGLAVFATPLCGYAYLRHNYKKMFSKEAYARVIDTEGYTSAYTINAITVPFLLGSSAVAGVITGSAIGIALSELGVLCGINIEIVKWIVLAASAAIPALIESKDFGGKNDNDMQSSICGKVDHYAKYLGYAALVVCALGSVRAHSQL